MKLRTIKIKCQENWSSEDDDADPNKNNTKNTKTTANPTKTMGFCSATFFTLPNKSFISSNSPFFTTCTSKAGPF